VADVKGFGVGVVVVDVDEGINVRGRFRIK
jgi:hypothetical protein